MLKLPGMIRGGAFRSLPWKLMIGIAIGGAAGFLYYYFVGCVSGSCPITSNPYGSVLYGGVIGAMVARI